MNIQANQNFCTNSLRAKNCTKPDKKCTKPILCTIRYTTSNERYKNCQLLEILTSKKIIIDILNLEVLLIGLKAMRDWGPKPSLPDFS